MMMQEIIEFGKKMEETMKKNENKKRVCPCCGKELVQHENMNFAICLTSGCPANFFNNFLPVAEWEMRVNRELEECLKKRNLNNIDEFLKEVEQK